MKKVGFLLILTFLLYLLGQVIWWFTISCEQPLFGSKYLEDIALVITYTLSAIFGLLSGITLYNIHK